MNHLTSVCLTRIMLNNDTQFFSKLPKNLQENYKTEKKLLIKEIDKKFSDTALRTRKKSEGLRKIQTKLLKIKPSLDKF